MTNLASTTDFVQFYGKMPAEAGPEFWLGGVRRVPADNNFAKISTPFPGSGRTMESRDKYI